MGKSIHFALLKEVQSRIRALRLDGLSEESVLVRWTPLFQDVGGRIEKNFSFPAIVVSPVGQEQITPATNERDDWGMPVLIAMAAQLGEVKATAASEEDLDRNLFWRERLLKTFPTKSLTTSDPAVEYRTCNVEPGPIVDWPKLQLEKIYTGYLVFRFKTRRDRTE